MSEQKNAIHIACAFDQNFITPFYVFLTSIFHNNRSSKFIFHTIAEDLPDSEIPKIKKFVSDNNGEINFYNISKELVKQYKLPDADHISAATYYRFYFPSLVPGEVKKLLYLDIDLVVVGNLSELYNVEMHGVAVGAVSDPKIGARPDLGVFNAEDYFNAGVLLIDLQEWRTQGITEKAFEFLTKFPEKASWADQDALNYVMAGKWYKLGKRFNVTYYDVPTYLKKKDFSNFLADKVIIHYTTQNKPWLLTSTNRLKFIYHHYLGLSPHADKRKYVDESLRSRYKYTLLKLKLKELIINYTNIYSLWTKLKSN